MPASEISKLEHSAKEYPELLKHTHEPPKQLYVKGNLPWEQNKDHWTIAIVGTRKPTEYGKTIAQELAKALAASGAVIVSGLATGIDRETHVGALKAGGKTVGVVGGGLDQASFFPEANWALAETIIKEGGAVISEYPEGTPALAHHFPERNRIIAGLSHGVIVVEAQEKSGALITARLALEENRDVFAVPGSIFSLTSKGPLRLIKEGATPILSVDDVFEFYGRSREAASAAPAKLEGLEGLVIEALREPRTLDELKEETHAETAALQASLSLLELGGKVREIEPGRYQSLLV